MEQRGREEPISVKDPFITSLLFASLGYLSRRFDGRIVALVESAGSSRITLQDSDWFLEQAAG